MPPSRRIFSAVTPARSAFRTAALSPVSLSVMRSFTLLPRLSCMMQRDAPYLAAVSAMPGKRRQETSLIMSAPAASAASATSG